MAESAPLLAAHAHARKAAEATQRINWNIAAEEHQHAAVEFARVAKGSSDGEALRVLRLLEEKHQKLADIIRSQDVTRNTESAGVDSTPGTRSVEHNHEKPLTDQDKSNTLTTTPSALASTRFGSQVRDSSPTLARDIASRRGIPQPGRNPPSAAAQARARQLSPESRRRNHGNPPSKIPPSIMNSQSNVRDTRSAPKTEDDDAFAKFYNNLTTGTMSKLSSALAYAGLPLSTEDQPADPGMRLKPDRRTVTVSNEPDVKTIFSKAALNVIEDEHRQHGTRGRVFGPAESFYVVQRGGGTYSYADIAKAQHQQHLAGVDEDDEQDFEDAREAQAPSPPRSSQITGQARNSFGKSRTQEELELENVTLKQTLEQVAQRLSEFETHAQDASMAVLTQSMISNPAATPDSSPALLSRLQQLERQLQDQATAKQQLQKDLEKKDKTLKKYRSTFEEIKKSAKEKEKAKREKAKKDAEEGPSESSVDAT